MSAIERARARSSLWLRKQSVLGLTRVACWIALIGLAVMALSILYPVPLTVVFAMSVGQVIGIFAFLCYLISIIVDVVRGTDHSL